MTIFPPEGFRDPSAMPPSSPPRRAVAWGMSFSTPASAYVYAAAIDLLVTWTLAGAGVAALAAQAGGLLCAALLTGRARAQRLGQPRRATAAWAAWMTLASLRGMILAALAAHGSPAMTLATLAPLCLALGPWSADRLARRWSVGADAALRPLMLLVAASLLLRLAGASVITVIPEEAYYWNYSRHLAAGYLDHPPAVALLIRASTDLFGHKAFALHLPALVCSALTALLTCRLARRYAGREAGWIAAAALSVMPGFFVSGLIITPDAPLLVCWAAALLFAAEALESDRMTAWILTGAAGGLGFLSKYTIGLVAAALVLQLLSSRRDRRFLRRPGPYAALLTALVVASPNIIWNATHGWCSYGFQSTRRLSASPHFGGFELLASILALMGPLLLAIPAAARSALPPGDAAGGEAGGVAGGVAASDAGGQAEARLRLRRFLRFQMIVPLAVFGLFSLAHAPKLNWPLPAMLSAVVLASPALLAAWRGAPLCGGAGAGRPAARFDRFSGLVLRPLRPAMLVTLGLLGCVGLWMAAEGPGLRLQPMSPATAWAWRRSASRLWPLQRRLSEQGRAVYLVGLDKYFLSSELAWYAEQFGGSRRFVAGRGIFGPKVHASGSLMWDRWVAPEQVRGAGVILVSDNERHLAGKWVARAFDSVSEIRVLSQDGPLGGRSVFYYRLGWGFRPPDAPAAEAPGPEAAARAAGPESPDASL